MLPEEIKNALVNISNIEERIEKISILLKEAGADFVQYSGGFPPFNQAVLLISDNFLDKLPMDTEKSIESFLSCQIKYTSREIQ